MDAAPGDYIIIIINDVSHCVLVLARHSDSTLDGRDWLDPTILHAGIRQSDIQAILASSPTMPADIRKVNT